MTENTYLHIENSGQDIVSTNFWNSEFALRGICFFSFNAGAIRLLLPQKREYFLREMRAAPHVKLIRIDTSARPMYRVIFDDSTSDPFRIETTMEAADRLLPTSAHGQAIAVSVWTQSSEGEPCCGLRLPGRFFADNSRPPMWS